MGNKAVTICNQLKLPSNKDGKFYKNFCSKYETTFRIIQSVPSQNAGLFKQWLAQVANECLNEIFDPELAMQRAI